MGSQQKSKNQLASLVGVGDGMDWAEYEQESVKGNGLRR